MNNEKAEFPGPQLLHSCVLMEKQILLWETFFFFFPAGLPRTRIQSGYLS